MKIGVDIDSRALQARTPREQKRLVYNVVQAINASALAAQKQIREDVNAHFKLRSTPKHQRDWLLKQIMVMRAGVRKGRLFAEIYVNTRPNRLLLAIFEDGGMREPFIGKTVAVPNPAEAREGGSIAGAVRPELTFRALNLTKHLTGTPEDDAKHSRSEWVWTRNGKTFRSKGEKQQLRGASGSGIFYAKTDRFPLGAVFRREGNKVSVVYSMHRAFQLRRLLQLVKIATETYQDRFAVELSIAYARGGGLPGGE